ncbi:unnamed protein product [Polarella glacialis]|uniref:1,4-alpha-glucan branching enzyme n=1 Tax=Polarella glacialis TaxID=89957 RepID=A0A813FKE4_POLGL|nr:unnamed protein product [Polarella glacialis]
MAKLKIFEIDPMLEGVQGQIWDRVNGYEWWKEELAKNEGGLEKFADGHKIYGWNREDGGWIYREWLPNAKQVFLIGDFNSWQNTTPLKSEGYGRWSVHLPDKADGAYALNHPSQIKVRLETNDGQWHDRVPAWAKLAWQDASTNLFNGVFWEPNPEDRYVFKHPRPDRPENLKIYEAHVGMASIEPKVATYTDFANDVLPRIKRLGYNAVQLMAVAEHAHYGCFGYHVTSFFAPASRQGTPEELKYLVDTAHGLGIQVLMDLVHAHASSNSLDGLAQMDGTDYCYTHGGPKGHHSEWDSKIFNYTKYEVMRFLLSNVKWWLTEYQFDGFRFDGITSMLYKSHGIGKGYTGGYHEYFGPDADIESHIYLMLANDLIHKTVPSAITVGEDVSGMPTLCLPVEDGGFGFDYRLAMAIPDMFIKYLKEGGDDDWDMGHIVHTLTNRRWKEKVVAYCESHDQSIVGDKTLAFWLMDAEMYTGMSLFTQPTPSPCVDRGLALHKMIRLLVLGLGGEAYLTFIGNEFGHPEWVDFPRPENGWSHQHCRRRWDLADDVLLRYKLFQSFEELMQACENRFKFLCASHQYVSCKSEGDKVIVFERGDLVFAFNFHPRNSYEGYQIGTSCDEPMRCILDSDEARFGGHMRLDYNPFPPCGAFNSRPNSVKVCMPSRTCQVLCRQSLLEGGVRIWVEDSFLAHSGLTSTKGLKISKEVWKEGQKETIDFSFNEAGCVELGLGFDATFDIVTADDTVLPCLASKDTKFRVYFPGDYTIAHLGYIKNGKPVDFEATEPAAPAAAAPVKERKVTFPEAKAAGYAAAPVPAAPVTPATPAATPAVTPAAVKAASPAVAAQKAPAGAPAQALPPAQKEAAEGPDEAAAADPRDMARCYSGLHFMSPEALGAALEETKGGMVRQVSEEDQLQGRLQDFTKNLTDIGGDIVKFAQSYKTFGLHKVAGGGWTFCEWMPNAKAVFLVGDFNAWDTSDMPLTEESAPGASGIWSGKIGVAKSAGLTQGSKYKLYVVPEVGEPYYVMPAWASRFVFTEQTRLLDAVVWDIEGSAPKRLSPSPTEVAGGERIYECHPGLAARSGKAASFAETAEFLFPRVARNGYTAVLLQGVLECKEYASMGSQPVGLFAVTRELGTPEELQALVAKAHALGLRVYMDLPHHGAACCEDGLGGHFFPVGADGFHPTSGARLYAYELPEVQRYLLSSLSFWMEIFGMDGFRFQDVGSIIYLDHGRWVPTSTAELDEYLSAGDKLDQAGLQYLMQANSLLHELDPNTCSIAEETSMFPNVCEPVSKGGLGFDMRQASAAPQLFRKLVTGCCGRDEDWSMAQIMDEISKVKSAREGETVLGFAESAEQCVVGRRPLKIAMLSWETLHTIAAGGVAPHVTELAGALHKAGHDVHIFTRSTNASTWEHNVWGVTYHEVSFDSNSDFVREIENMCSAFVGDLLQVEPAVGGFDIIHGHDWLVGPAVAQLQSRGKRVIFTMHSTETGRCGNVAYGGQSARIRAIEGHACHAAERVIAVSGVLKDEVCSHYSVHGAKVEVIYNGIHAEQIAKMEWEDEWTGNTKKDKGFDVMDPMFLFVGRLAVQKGPDLLLEAIPMILSSRGNAKFVIVGDGHMKAALEARAAQLGISHAVHFAGSVKSGSAHLKALFKSCDAVVVPSRNEPFGIVVLEAWAAGKPVVATTCGGPRDFVKPDREGYLVDPNPSSIAWGICKICENFEHSRWMGSVAKAKALEEFNWDFIARQTEQVYYEQLCLHGAPRCRTKGPGAGAPLAASLLGPCRDAMGVLDQNHLVKRGLCILKQTRLLAASLGCDATLTWMGNEFGQIDSVDMPRAANGFNKEQALVAYALADDKGLKHKHLEMFELCLNRTGAALQWLKGAKHTVIVADEEAKVLAYARGGCIFVMNFHPSTCHEAYRLDLPKGLDVMRELSIFFDTEDPRFGGAASAPLLMPAGKVNSGLLQLRLPPRCGLVLGPATAAAALSADRLLQCGTADALINGA